MVASRARFRSYALDGAMLYFHPDTGTNVRIASASTHAQRRTAPRVAMFGITNACNLACDFCSRDTTRDSLWTVGSAAALLRGLAEAGTLEVAFGGGEPFAFRGFAELLAELHATTPLTLNVTTNGTLLRPPLWRRVRPYLGQVRVSIYPGTPWRAAADTLAGARWGANVLVDAAALATLPTLLAELAARGCRDVSLLSYVGADRGRHLDRAGDAQLARIIVDAPLPCRLSVCFGARVAVPRLFAGDCGAGYDFISITPDQRVQSCSFQDRTLPGATVDEVLAAWRRAQSQLAQPSPRAGCARSLPLAAQAPPPIAIWQAFSGNNSGECILVATFETIPDAERFLAELVPGWQPDAPYSPAWQALFAAERIAVASQDSLAPVELDQVDRSVIALAYDAGDAFPELRALAWKRGAAVSPGGIHVHDITALVGIRARDRDDARALAASPIHATATTYLHGDRILVTLPFKRGEGPGSLAALKALLPDRPTAIELVEDAVADADIIRIKQRLGDPIPAHPRLFLAFHGHGGEATASARRFAAALDEERVHVAANGVLIDPIVRRKRAAVLAHRHGAHVTPLEGLVVAVSAHYWMAHPSKSSAYVPLARDALVAALAKVPSVVVDEDANRAHGYGARIETADPATALAHLAGAAETVGCDVVVRIEDRDPLAWTIRRLLGRESGG